MKNKIILGIFSLVLLAIVSVSSVALASHSWENYHWPKVSKVLVLKLGDNVTPQWDYYLATSSRAWSLSTVLDTTVVAGQSSSRTCKPVSGRVEVCNNKYGNNGWLGVAQIWINGEHITQATTKLNDTYFNTATYNTVAWRNLVMCQEIGHTFGLNHQDENFSNANLGTCMDYTSSPSSNQSPNLHDYEQLVLIYSHSDVFNTTPSQVKTNGNATHDDKSSWGKEMGKDGNGKANKFEKELGDGNKLITHVFWVE